MDRYIYIVSFRTGDDQCAVRHSFSSPGRLTAWIFPITAMKMFKREPRALNAVDRDRAPTTTTAWTRGMCMAMPFIKWMFTRLNDCMPLSNYHNINAWNTGYQSNVIFRVCFRLTIVIHCLNQFGWRSTNFQLTLRISLKRRVRNNKHKQRGNAGIGDTFICVLVKEPHKDQIARQIVTWVENLHKPALWE